MPLLRWSRSRFIFFLFSLSPPLDTYPSIDCRSWPLFALQLAEPCRAQTSLIATFWRPKPPSPPFSERADVASNRPGSGTNPTQLDSPRHDTTTTRRSSTQQPPNCESPTESTRGLLPVHSRVLKSSAASSTLSQTAYWPTSPRARPALIV